MRKVGPKVPMDECKLRALKFLVSQSPGHLVNASQVAYAIWTENNNMRGQGAGLIGARILRLLKTDGLVYWDHRKIGKFEDWGWRITSTGREHLKFIEGQYNV
jgi:hypothetical protein